MEAAAKQHKLGQTWKIINKLSGKSEARVIKVKKLDGSVPKTDTELMDDWATYFEKLLNADKTDPLSNLPEPAEKDLPIKTDQFTVTEFEEAIEQMKYNKSPGGDSCIVAEILRDGGSYIRSQLYLICCAIYESGVTPNQWKINLITPIFKKGSPLLMTNYRGISLMSIAAKVYNKILANRVVPETDKILRNLQAGFRRDRSCTQQIHILRRIMEGASSKQLPLFLTFVDFKKAFDSISRRMMFAILRHYGIPAKIVQAIKVLYDGSTSRVFVEGKLSRAFHVTTGVLQGDVLAPSLFIIVMDYVMRKSDKEEFGFITHLRRSNRHPAIRLNDLDFADDIALLSSSCTLAEQQVKCTSDNANEVGLEIHIDKTRVMILNGQQQQQTITLNGQPIGIEDDFKYLGSHMQSSRKDFTTRRGQAWGAFRKLKTIWASATTPLSLKLRIFTAACLAVLCYGSEAWILDKKTQDDLDVFATNCYRSMLGVRRLDKVSNEEIYRRVQQQPLSTTLAARQLTWVGHMLRRPEDEPIRRYALYEPEEKLGKKKVGGQNQSYASSIAKLLNPGFKDNEIKLTAKEIEKMAQDRVQWKKRVIACTGFIGAPD
jgi:hypothetical protein